MSKSYMNLDVTYKYARDKLAARDPEEVAVNSGVDYDLHRGGFRLVFLGDTYLISYPSGEVELVEGGEAAMTNKILILHYLVTASGAPLQNRYISFKELPDGAIYITPFTNRAIRPLLSLFADRQEELKEIAVKMGGRVENIGDTGITLFPFPHVPVTYVIWSGDEEFPASGNILFDASAPYYLPTEDYAVLASTLVYHMGKLLQRK